MTDPNRTLNPSAPNIDDVIASNDSDDKKLQTLQGMKTELQARLAKDSGSDLAPLSEQIDSAIDGLSSAGGETGTRSALKTD